MRARERLGENERDRQREMSHPPYKFSCSRSVVELYRNAKASAVIAVYHVTYSHVSRDI